MRIGVLVMTYNQKEMTLAWIDAFKALFGSRRDLYPLILDNASTDGTYQVVRERHPDIDIRRLNDNYGCVTGRNVGVAELYLAGFDFVLNLDNDIRIEDHGLFDKLLSAAERYPETDAFCPVVRGKFEGSVHTMGQRIRWNGGRINIVDYTPGDDTRVDIIPGGASFVRLETYVRFGLYDNDFSPISIEDYEWSTRLHRQGARFRFVPQAEVIHYHDLRQPDSPAKQAFHVVGHMVLLRKRPTPVALLKEARFMHKTLSKFGLRFAAEHALRGLRKPIVRKNWVFDDFVAAGLERFYDPALGRPQTLKTDDDKEDGDV